MSAKLRFKRSDRRVTEKTPNPVHRQKVLSPKNKMAAKQRTETQMSEVSQPCDRSTHLVAIEESLFERARIQ